MRWDLIASRSGICRFGFAATRIVKRSGVFLFGTRELLCVCRSCRNLASVCNACGAILRKLMVTVAFVRIAGATPRVEGCIAPRSELRLTGRCLYDGDGLLLAELVLDQEGREFWQAQCEVNDPNAVGNLFPELVFVGQGKLNL